MTREGGPAHQGSGVPAWRVERLGEVDSTQEVVKRRLARGEDVAGLIVRARSQTSGRGRRANAWQSAAGGSYQTITLSDHLGSGLGAGITLAVGVGLAEELAGGGARCMVKWPNDLYYRDRKLGGILVERVKGHLLIGVGINVENAVPPGGVALRSWPVATVEDLVVSGVERALALLAGPRPGLSEELLLRFRGVDWLAGRRVAVQRVEVAPPQGGGAPFSEVTVSAPPVSGVAAGIDGEGCLLLAVEPDGALVRVCSGTVVAVNG